MELRVVESQKFHCLDNVVDWLIPEYSHCPGPSPELLDDTEGGFSIDGAAGFRKHETQHVGTLIRARSGIFRSRDAANFNQHSLCLRPPPPLSA